MMRPNTFTITAGALLFMMVVWAVWPLATDDAQLFMTLGTLGSAFFTGLSALAARESAEAARDAIGEQRRSRLELNLPRLSLEASTPYLLVEWRPADDASITLRRGIDPYEMAEADRGGPILRLRNFGGGPALDLKAEIVLGGGAGELKIPPAFSVFRRDDLTAELTAEPYGLAFRKEGTPSSLSSTLFARSCPAPFRTRR